MKSFIVAMAVTLLLLAFPLQYVQNQRTHANIMFVQKVVHNAKEQAKQEGCFTDAVINDMRAQIADQLRVSPSEILITADSAAARKQRGELIYYKVSYPVKNVVAAVGFWGISDNDNTATRVIENYTSSEWLP